MNKKFVDTYPRWTDSILVKLVALLLLIDAVGIAYFSILRLSGLLMASLFIVFVQRVLFYSICFFAIGLLIIAYRYKVVSNGSTDSNQIIIKSLKKERLLFSILMAIFFIMLRSELFSSLFKI